MEILSSSSASCKGQLPIRDCYMCTTKLVASRFYIKDRIDEINRKITQKISESIKTKIIQELMFWSKYSMEGENYLKMICIIIKNKSNRSITLTFEDFEKRGFDDVFFMNYKGYSVLHENIDQFLLSFVHSIELVDDHYLISCDYCKKQYCSYHSKTFPFKTVKCSGKLNTCIKKLYVCDNCHEAECDECIEYENQFIDDDEYDEYGDYGDFFIDDF